MSVVIAMLHSLELEAGVSAWISVLPSLAMIFNLMELLKHPQAVTKEMQKRKYLFLLYSCLSDTSA
jgi:hypothetical protein